MRAFLERVDHPFARALTVQLDDIVRGSVDRAFLTTFGRFWADRAEPLHLVEPDEWRVALATAATTLQQGAIRPLLVSGERLVGKTSFLRLLAGQVTRQGWSVPLWVGRKYRTVTPGRRNGHLNNPDGIDLVPPNSLVITHARAAHAH